MNVERIQDLLAPFLGGETLGQLALQRTLTYVNVLVKWNARMNLTGITDPEQMVRRHFGESLFAARHLLGADASLQTADVGSGAGFPGLPINIYAPGVRTTLIEAQSKKAVFLKEVARECELTNVNVINSRAESLSSRFDLVTMRAVEKFTSVLPVAGTLVAHGGRLALLVGEEQLGGAQGLLEGRWAEPIAIPESNSRVLAVVQL